MPSANIREYIDEANCLLHNDEQLGSGETLRQETIKEWLDRYQSCIKKLSSALSAAKKIKKDLSLISQVESTLNRLCIRANLYKSTNNSSNPTKKSGASSKSISPYVRMALLHPKDKNDDERDELSEMIYNRICELRSITNRYFLKQALRETENKWSELLKKTADIPSRQIIKEALNDCLAIRKENHLLEVSDYKAVPTPSLSLPSISDIRTASPFAIIDTFIYSRRAKNVNGDTIMFFDNGDILVLDDNLNYPYY